MPELTIHFLHIIIATDLPPPPPQKKKKKKKKKKIMFDTLYAIKHIMLQPLKYIVLPAWGFLHLSQI